MKIKEEFLTPYAIGSLSCLVAAFLVLLLVICLEIRAEFWDHFNSGQHDNE